MAEYQTFVVLGATGGIGSELCRRLTAGGAKVVIAARDPGRLREMAASLGAEPVALDATLPEQVEACARRAIDRFGRLDGIANCVGSLLLKPAHLTSDAEWASTIASNLTSAFAAVRAAAKTMLQTGGSVVLISAAAARTGIANHEAIAAAKAGVIGLTLSAASTYARQGLRINCVAPGLVRTPLTARLLANEAQAKVFEAMHPLGRLGEPGDVAAAIAWLLDPAQNWITGQVFAVDGGLSTVRPRT